MKPKTSTRNKRKRSKSIFIRITEKEKKMFLLKARKNGWTFSEFARRAMETL